MIRVDPVCFGSVRVAPDYEFLTAVHAHLHPRAGAQSRLVYAGTPLRDEPFEPLFLN